MKVVITSSCYRPTVQDWIDELEKEFNDVTFQAATTVEEQKRHIRDADVYFGFPMSEVFREARRLRWIHRSGTGMDVLSRTPEVVESDVIVTNTRGPHATAMADHVMGMMLILAHRFREIGNDQRAHGWSNSRSYIGNFVELNGQTLGILALGDVGSAVARRAHGFGMKVYAVDKHPKPPWYRPPEVTEVWGLDRLDDLIRISDWFVVTSPLTPESRGLIPRYRVEMLKPGAYVIVISRPHILDEQALYDGLRSGRIAGAGLDIVTEAPPDDIWDMDNVVLSPHCSYVTQDCFEGRRQVFKENLRRFLAGQPFLYVCDKRAGF